MAIAKDERVEDEPYLAWCRTQPCAFCLPRRVPAEPHHVLLKGMGGATRRDDLCVPTCRTCHDRCHGVTVVTAGGARLGPIQRSRQLEQAKAHRERYENRGNTIPF